MTEFSLPKILLVDDEKDNLDALSRILRKDFEVTTALSGEEALQRIHSQKNWAVVVSDQRMPGISGSEFLAQVRQLLPHATRILLTGFADIEAVVEAVNRGEIWRYIAKPWEPEELKMTLKQAAERARMAEALEVSRRELERSLLDLRARDWSRERLLKLLLHEFRTAPQIIEGLRSLDPGGDDAEARNLFLNRLTERFSILEKDIVLLLDEEKRARDLPRDTVVLQDVIQAVFPTFKSSSEPVKILSHKDSLVSVLKGLQQLLTSNSAQAPLELRLEIASPQDAFVELKLKSSNPILPTGLLKENLDPRLAWPLLLQPFVGSEDFHLHSSGLRTDTARLIRLLTALGARAEFEVSSKGDQVSLVLQFKVQS
jgi:two-component system sensor histidine kinase/response regulator